jgi:CRISPR-associated protein Cmr2
MTGDTPSTWLLKCGVGSVQEFIAQARKTRDLAAGSEIVAEVARSAVQHARNIDNVKILLPQDRTGNFKACPHQIVLRIENTDAERVRVIGQAIVEEMSKCWNKLLTRHSFKNKEIPIQNRTDLGVFANEKDAISNQVKASFDASWVAVPGENAFSELGLLYDDRRQLRTFEQLAPLQSEKNWACAQCGARAAVLDPNQLKIKFDKDGQRTLFSSRDQLCAVCLGKRLRSAEQGSRPRPPSTRELAASRVLRMKKFEPFYKKKFKIDEKDFLDLLDLEHRELEEITGGAPTDNHGQKIQVAARALLKARGERPGEQTENDFHFPSWSPMSDLQNRSVESLSTENDFHFPSWSPYYAIIVFDGDEMGKWFSGEYFVANGNAGAHSLDDKRRELGEALHEFARTLREMLADEDAYKGAYLVYAGGDDGFVLSPLDAVLPLMYAIHEKWRNTAGLIHGRKDCKKVSPTFSLHASLVHEKEPLQPVVASLHTLLKETKDCVGRDAFSIRAEIHSGTSSQMLCKWEELESVAKTVEAFSTWKRDDVAPAWKPPNKPTLDERKKEAFATRLLYSLVDTTGGYFSNGAVARREALGWELDRLIARSKDGTRSAETDERDLRWDKMREWLLSRCDGISGPRSGRESFESALKVVGFLARQLNWDENV